MPTYRITDPNTGKVVKLTGDSPPTEAELNDIFAKVGTESPAQPVTAQASPATFGGVATDVAKGIGEGILNTVSGTAKLLLPKSAEDALSGARQRMGIPPVSELTTPANTTQAIAKGAEQIGEFFLPLGVAGKAAKAAEIAKAAMLTSAQGGGPGASAVSAGLTAVLPGASAAAKVGSKLQESAEATMARALNATKEWAKAESEKLAPEMLKRGIGGSISSMRDLAKKAAAKAGQNLEDAYTVATAAGESVPGQIVQGNIQLARDALHVTLPNGSRIAVPGHEAAIAQLDKLDEFVGQLGADIPVDKAAYIKRTWDDIVSKAGLFGQNKMAPASEKAQAWSFRQASDAFRQLLNTNPTRDALNKEASFWIGLRDVLNASKLRKTGQTGGLTRMGSAATGAAVGGLTGDTYSERGMNALLGAVAAQKFTQAVQSPYFLSKVSAPTKQALADALASQNAGKVMEITKTILEAMPARVAEATR